MPRGGKRKGAGRKSAWNTGKTKAVKLPELLIPEIVAFARMIDSTLVDGLIIWARKSRGSRSHSRYTVR